MNYVFELYDGECDQINDDDGEGVLDVPTCKMLIKELYGDESEKKLSPGAKEYVWISHHSIFLNSLTLIDNLGVLRNFVN